MGIIEARAVITADDKTGGVFAKIAGKFKEIASSAKALEGIKPAVGNWGTDFQKQVERLKVSSRDLDTVKRSWESFNNALRPNGQPMKAATYFGAIGDWKRQTLADLRQVRAGMEQTESMRAKMFRGAAGGARMAAGALGLGSAAYAVQRGGKAVALASASRQRELARYGLAGMSADEQAQANAKADEISAKLPSVSRTDVLGHIRQLRSRLGDFHHAIDNAETTTRAQVMLNTLGHGGEGSAQDLEKLVLGLESQGIGSDPAKFKTYLNAFVKAKSLFQDLRGDDFRQYMQNANSSKYGLSEDYLTNVVPTMMQHEGSHNFGTMQASAFSALIGERQTKAAKAMLAQYGLIGDDGHIVDSRGMVTNPYEWSKSRLGPSLEKQGVSMDADHREDMVIALTRMFSNRKVGEFFASLLVNKPVIEKDRPLLAAAKGTEGADEARRNDPFAAASALTTQLKDAGTAIIAIRPVIDGLNAIAEHVGNFTSKFDQDDTAGKTGKLLGLGAFGGMGLYGAFKATQGASKMYQWFTGSSQLTVAATALEGRAAALTSAAARIAAGGAASVAGAAATPAAAAAAGGATGWLARVGAMAPGILTSPAAIAAGVIGGMAVVGKVKEDAGTTGLTGSEAAKKATGGSRLDHLRDAWNEERDRLGVPRVGAGEQPVKAEVEGNATLTGNITVSASPMFWTSLDARIDGKINAFKATSITGQGTQGSTGRSSPDAAPSP